MFSERPFSMKKALEFGLFSALFCINVHEGFSQISSGFEANFGVGKMLKIFSTFPERDLHRQFNLNYTWRNQSAYAKAYRNHENQVCLSFHQYGNDTVLGKGIGLQYRMRLKKDWKHFGVFTTLGFGGVYNTLPYDYLTNRENTVLGSRIQALISYETGFQIPIKQWNVGASFIMWHSSNMHTQLPNVGLNTPMINLKASYQMQRFTKEKVIDPIANQHEWNLRGVWGRNEAGTTGRPTNGPKYSKWIGVIGYSYRFKNIHRVSVDLEGYYDQTYRLYNEIGENESSHPALQSSALMLMFGHEFLHGHFGLVTHVGVNLYNPTINYLYKDIFGDGGFSMGQLIPVRVAARYYFLLPETNKLSPYLQFGVKSNFGLADYLELGVGFILPKRSKQS